MKSILLFITVLCCSISVSAQVGIGTTDPDPASVLDISATDKGIMIPRVALDDVTNNMLDGINTSAQGMLLFNTNETTLGGDGAGFYFYNGTEWEKLSGGAQSEEWYKNNTVLPATSINDSIYRMGNVSIGRPDTPSPLSVYTTTQDTVAQIKMFIPGDSNQSALDITSENTGSGRQIAFVNKLTKRGTGEQFGFYSVLDGDTDGQKVGLYNTIRGQGNGIHYGLLNTVIGNGVGDKYGVSSAITGEGEGNMYALSNQIVQGGNGEHAGLRNILYSNGSGNHFGIKNQIDGITSGTNFGMNNRLRANGTGRQYGVENNIAGTSSGNQYGVSNSFTNDENGNHFGVINTLNGDGNGIHYGTYNSINNLGNGNRFGEYTFIKASGTGTKYGNYISITDTSGGDQYGLFVNMPRTTGTVYAAYFLGKVSVGRSNTDNYIFPLSRGTAGQVMQSDGAGNLTWVDLAASRPDRSNEIEALTAKVEQLMEMVAAQQRELELIKSNATSKQ